MADRSRRQQMMDFLNEEEMNSLEISQAVGIGEREVPLHLEHSIRTLAKKDQKLQSPPPPAWGADTALQTARA